MIEILESPKYLVAMKVFGKLTADDVKAAYNAVEDALKDHERISFFAEIEDSVGITVDGLLKDLTEGQRISFEVEPDKKGKGPKAVNLVVS